MENFRLKVWIILVLIILFLAIPIVSAADANSQQTDWAGALLAKLLQQRSVLTNPVNTLIKKIIPLQSLGCGSAGKPPCQYGIDGWGCLKDQNLCESPNHICEKCPEGDFACGTSGQVPCYNEDGFGLCFKGLCISSDRLCKPCNQAVDCGLLGKPPCQVGIDGWWCSKDQNLCESPNHICEKCPEGGQTCGTDGQVPCYIEGGLPRCYNGLCISSDRLCKQCNQAVDCGDEGQKPCATGGCAPGLNPGSDGLCAKSSAAGGSAPEAEPAQEMITFTYISPGTTGSLSTREINQLLAAGGTFVALRPDKGAFDIQSVSIPVSLLNQPDPDWPGYTWADIVIALRQRSYAETDTTGSTANRTPENWNVKATSTYKSYGSGNY